MADIEKTCENCEYECEDMEGTHCRHCIHNAEEHFEPKIICDNVQEIRNKAIDEFAEQMKEKWIEADDLSISSEFFEFVDKIAERLKKEGAV